MPEKCSAVTTFGELCQYNARTDGLCGTHARNRKPPIDYELNLRARLIWMMHYLSPRERQLFGNLQMPLPIPHDATREQLLGWIDELETFLQQYYPTWTKPFTRNKIREINEHRIESVITLVERRIPENLWHQRGLLHDWFKVFHDRLSTVLDLGGMAITLQQVYNPVFVTETIRPLLVAQWQNIPENAKDVFRRAFRNMGLLGQDHIRNIGNDLPNPPPIQRQNNFVDDNQNVHRSETVKYVLDTYNNLMKIHVPDDQKTLSEILHHCELSNKAITQLVHHYCDPVNIYELPKPYPKALDAVWAFIRAHPEKKELYNRVKDELTDNVGMCAQGQLSRLCNILSGYMEGVTIGMSKNEILQEKISKIATDEEGNKVERVKAILGEMEIPDEEWGVWIDALDGF